MEAQELPDFFHDWQNEINTSVIQSNSLCIALFSDNKELLYANSIFRSYLKGTPHENFLNPSFDKLLGIDHHQSKIFEGYLTIGNYDGVSSSIFVHIFRKNKELLLIGGSDINLLHQQNQNMHKLNREISHLQRELIKEKNNLKNTLEQLKEANEALKILNINKDRFMAVLAHDLKSPFNLILGYSDFILETLDELDKADIKKQLQVVNKTAYQTFFLLEDLLLWSKSQYNTLDFSPIKLLLSEISDEVIESLQTQAVAKNITLHNEVASGIHIYADYHMLKAVLRNLISNSIKFTHEGGFVKTNALHHNGSIKVVISDNGVGMDRKTRESLWGQSTDISTTGTSGEKGTGFGLMLCKEFVEKHRGEIWVESTKGKGSHFNFSIPAKDV